MFERRRRRLPAGDPVVDVEVVVIISSHSSRSSSASSSSARWRSANAPSRRSFSLRARMVAAEEHALAPEPHRVAHAPCLRHRVAPAYSAPAAASSAISSAHAPCQLFPLFADLDDAARRRRRLAKTLTRLTGGRWCVDLLWHLPTASSIAASRRRSPRRGRHAWRRSPLRVDRARSAAQPPPALPGAVRSDETGEIRLVFFNARAD